MATIVTRSGKGSALTHEEMDDNFSNLNTDKLETSGGSVTGDINFGDNDKAQFGAGNDLQIYHDGSNSYISENGTGILEMRTNGSEVRLNGVSGAEYMLRALSNGGVKAYYDNSLKLETTSTGIDVANKVTIKNALTDSNGLKLSQESGDESRIRNHYAGSLTFGTNDTERMRIDSSGNLLVGTTNSAPVTSGNVNGIALQTTGGNLQVNRDGGIAAYFGRKTSDGDIVNFYKDGTAVGSIGTDSSGNFAIDVQTSVFTFSKGGVSQFQYGTTAFAPWTDNAKDLGASSYRFDDVYATNGTIQTSDQNDKQQIASLTDAEMNVAKRLSALFKTFKWNSSVEENGDNARTHTGIIAQDMQQAFTDEGLDAGNYAMFISGTWWEKEISVDAVEAVEGVEATYDEEGNELTPAVEEVEGKDAYTYIDTKQEATEGYTERTRLGVRYPELFAFINAYNDQRFADLEARITALEA